jgi:hypothetical protein
MKDRGDKFRQHAEECLRLERTLINPEHRLLAAEFAAAWTALAEWSDKFQDAQKPDLQSKAEQEKPALTL